MESKLAEYLRLGAALRIVVRCAGYKADWQLADDGFLGLRVRGRFLYFKEQKAGIRRPLLKSKREDSPA